MLLNNTHIHLLFKTGGMTRAIFWWICRRIISTIDSKIYWYRFKYIIFYINLPQIIRKSNIRIQIKKCWNIIIIDSFILQNHKDNVYLSLIKTKYNNYFKYEHRNRQIILEWIFIFKPLKWVTILLNKRIFKSSKTISTLSKIQKKKIKRTFNRIWNVNYFSMSQ